MDADLDTLAAALYVRTDDVLNDTGQVRLARRRDAHAYPIPEVEGPEAGPVLQQYAQVASATRQYPQADQNDPVESFIAEAGPHPVFEPTPIDPDARLWSPEGPGPK